jgi:GxxExxY protein
VTENEISYKIRGAIFNVYKSLGPGLLESAYEAVLSYELNSMGLYIKTQVPLPLVYKEVKLDIGYRMDIVVEEKVIVEVKSIETLLDVHHKQLITYLKISGLKLGILVNFNSEDINKDIIRKVNNL